MENPTPAAERRCPCGHGRDHPSVHVSCSYTTLGYLGLMFGASARPHTIRFECRDCGVSFDQTTDPAACSRYA